MSPVKEAFQRNSRRRIKDIPVQNVYLVTSVQDELYIGTLDRNGIVHSMKPLKHIQTSRIPIGSKFILKRSQMTRAQTMEAISILGLTKA